jgi:hypothetical protein
MNVPIRHSSDAALARLARTNPGSIIARDEARAEWRRRHPRRK